MFKWLVSLFVDGTVSADKFITKGGDNTQFVKGDGSLDNNDYVTQTEMDESIDSSIDGIKAGAVNLAKVSDIGYNPTYTTYSEFKYTMNTAGASGIVLPSTLFKPFSQYVISFKIKKITGSVLRMGGHSSLISTSKVYRNDTLVANNWSTGDINYPNDTDTYVYTIILTTGDMLSGNNAFHIQPNRPNYSSETYLVEIWDIQLESGNIRTDWKPSEVDQISDWNETNVNSVRHIKNKPNTFTPSPHTHTVSDITDFNDSDYVHISGPETIVGVKTFNNNNTYVTNFKGLTFTTVKVGDETLSGKSDILFENYKGQLFVGMDTKGFGIISSTSGANGISFMTSGSEKMLLNNDGNLAIGGSNTGARLHLTKSSINDSRALQLTNPNGVSDASVSIKFNAGESSGLERGTILQHKRNGSLGGDFIIKTSPTLDGASLDRFVVTKDGNVGINDMIPYEKLSVGGKVFSEGYVVNNGASSQFLKGDGSLDSNTYLVPGDISGYATQSWVGDNFDKYTSWGLSTNGIQRTTIKSGDVFDLIAGSNITLSYAAGGKVTINSSFENTDTTYTAGTGIFISPTNVIHNTITDNSQLDNGAGYITGFTESDPTVPSHVKSILASDINTWNSALQASDLNGYATQSWVSTNYEPKFSKNTAFNKDFGTVAGTVAEGNHTHAWSQITGKPTTFTPSTHTHPISQVTNLQDELDGKVDKVTGKGLSTNDYTTTEKSKLAGIEAGAEVNVQADWDATTGDALILNKPSAFPPTTHTHDDRYYTETESDTLFAPMSHTHLWVDITDKPTTFPPSTHSHSWSSITGKPSVFPPSAHTHDLSELSDTTISSITNGEILKWSGTKWVNNTLSEAGIQPAGSYASSLHTHAWVDITGKPNTFTPSAHTHPISDVTGLQGELDNKVDKIPGKVLSSNDYTNAEKTKLSGIEAGAEVNVQSDWNATTGDALILNKPTSFTPSTHTHPISQVIDLQDELDGKVDKVVGKGLSTNDYTGAEKGKLAGIEAGAEVNVQSDWNATTGDAFIKNKPSTFTPSTHSHPISQVSGLQTALNDKSSIGETGRKLLANTSNSTISLLDANDNVLDTLDVGFLNNEGTTLEYNSTNETIDIKNDAGTVLSSIPVSSFMTNIGSNLQLSGSSLELRDAGNNVLSTVNIGIGNVSGLQTALNNKVDKISGKGLSSNDYTNAEKTKLSGIEAGAEVNVQSDWNATSGDALILNKPTIPSLNGYATQSWVSANYEPKFGKNNAFNKNFGTSAGTVSEGNHTHTLSQLSDTTITSIANGEILRWNGTKWINNTLSQAGIQPAGSYSLTSHTHSWSQITGKPSTFTPSSHTHPISQVTNLQDELDGKVDKVTGKGLSTNDYTTTEKNKLAGIEAGAEVNVQADWNATTGDAFIKNKPSTFTPSSHTHSFSSLTSKPTTISGYGITDFNSLGDARWAPLSHTHSATQITSGTLSYSRLPFSSTNVSNWNTAYGWGNHAGNYSSRATGGGTANSIISLDTRNINETPNTDRNRGLWVDFKSNSTISLTGAGTYSGVLTLLPYTDNSGNGSAGGRIALSNGNLYVQQALTTSYGSWSKLLTSSDFDISDYATQSWVSANYEPKFSKNNAFNKNFGTSAGTVAEGNHTHPISDVSGLQTELNGKVDKISGKGLSTNDYTTTEKNKLAGIEAGAEVNVQSDWNATTGDAFIKNKPSTFTPSSHTHSATQITSGTLSYDRLPFSSANVSNWNTAYGWGNHDEKYIGSSMANKSVNTNLFTGDFNTDVEIGNYGMAISSSSTNQPPSIGTPRTLLRLGARSASENITLSDFVIGTSGASFRLNNTTTWSRLWTSSDFTSSNISTWNSALQASDLNGYATQSWVLSKNYLVASDISNKVDKIAGKGLSTNDYTNAEKSKLAGIEAGAEVNVQADWNATSGDALILNKPTIPSLNGYATQSWVSANYEPKFTKYGAFNKNFGTSAGTVAEGNHTHTLSQLTDTTITSVANGEILRWNGTKWINNTLSQAGIQPAGSYASSSHSHSWSQITGKPTTFTPSTHSHPISQVSGLQTALNDKSSIGETGRKLLANSVSSTISLLDANDTVLSTIDVGFLNNEGTTLEYNSTNETIDIKNDAGTVLSSIPVSSFMTNIGSNLQLSGSSLRLRDAGNNILSTVTIAVGNVSGLQTALDSKAPTSRSISAGTGLSGGGNLTTNRTISLNASSIASLGKADSAVQPSDLTPYALDSNVIHKTGNESKSGKLTLNNDFEVGGTSSQGGVYTIDNNVIRVNNPKGATKYLGSSATGAIKVSLPKLYPGSMLKFVIEIYDYSTNESLTINVGGYAYGGSNWANEYAYITTGNVSKDFTVRFGDSGGKSCVWIGELTSTWSHTIVSVPYFMCGYGSIDSGWADGWSVDVDTAFGTIKRTQSNNLVASDWNKLDNKPSTFTASSHTHPISQVTNLQTELNAKAPTSRSISAGTGLSGGGNLTTNRTISLNASSIASLGKADSAVQPSDLTPYATQSWANSNFDKYTSWNLKTNGVQRTTVSSGGDLDLIGGSNVTLSYGAGGKVTINSSYTNSTYSLISAAELDSTSNTTARLISGQRANAWGDAKYSPISHSHSWGQITGKPSTFTPSTHTHDLSELGDTTISSVANGEILRWNGTKWINNTLSQAGIQPAGSYASSSHNHSWSQITSKPSTFPPSAHTHAWGDITGKPTTFPPSAHSHSLASLSDATITSVANGEILRWDGTKWINNTLSEAGIQPAGSYASSSHSHSWAQITGKPSTFPPSSHSHAWADISGKPATFTPSPHTHSIADVTSLQSTLDTLQNNIDSKANKTTTISAGTGLSGGGNISANRVFNVVYGTAANTSAMGNDSRINNGQTAYNKRFESISTIPGGGIKITLEDLTGGVTTLRQVGVADARNSTQLPGSNGSSSYSPLPSDGYLDNAITGYFTQNWPGPSWGSVLNIKGWSGSYASWQLAGGANSTHYNDFYFRGGSNNLWGNWYKVIHEGNVGSITNFVKKTGDSMSGDLDIGSNNITLNSINLGSNYSGLNEYGLYDDDYSNALAAKKRVDGIDRYYYGANLGTPSNGIVIPAAGNSAGYVGVGLSNPVERLDVKGFVKANGFISNGGTSTQYLMADGSVSTGGGGTYLETSFTLNQTQLRNLSSSQYQILPAPGANKAYEVVSVTYFRRAGAGYNNANFTYIGGWSTTDIKQVVFSDRIYKFQDAIGIDIPQPNTPLKIRTSSNSTSGDGNITFYVTYRIIDL